MDEQEEVQQNNMISNLPLLFANGYPTSLEKITESQLENFIPFMVRCSLGHINQQEKFDYSEPEWWPENIPFTVPFCKPKKFNRNWMEKMKEIVFICYQFHKSLFLLRFCNDLASYEPASLRFINNYNCTTSLFDRRSNKLLVTFRNENMSYDQPQRIRKCLLQRSNNELPNDDEAINVMVEPAPFEIYLCENCDAELYSQEAILEHEKTCLIEEQDDDDVIICGDGVDSKSDEHDPTSCNNAEETELCKGFLLNFNLQFRDEKKAVKKSALNTSCSREEGLLVAERTRRMPRRNRGVQSLTRCATIPLSSPAGQLLLRTTKTVMTPEYLTERLERLERFCHAPILHKLCNKPKYLDRKFTFGNPHCTFKRPQDYSSHIYMFPRRQFSQGRRDTANIVILNSTLMKRCRPISVRVRKITEDEIRSKQSPVSNKLNIKLTRDAGHSASWKILPTAAAKTPSQVIIDTIDLCSSDEEDSRGRTRGALTTFQERVPTLESLNRKLDCQINPQEISLIPLGNCNVAKAKQAKTSNSGGPRAPKVFRVIAASAGDINENNNEKHLSQNIDRNVMQSTNAVSGENTIALPKPLRRSVYILSNYIASASGSIPTIVPSVNELGGLTDGSNRKNLAKSVSSAKKMHRRTNSIISTAQSWYAGAGTEALTSNAQSAVNQNIASDDYVTRSLSLVQPFTPSSCVVSIDLTS